MSPTYQKELDQAQPKAKTPPPALPSGVYFMPKDDMMMMMMDVPIEEEWRENPKIVMEK